MRVYGRSYFQYKRFKMADLNININGLSLKNPVLTASGTFGYGTEFQDFIDLERLGGFIVKGTTLKHREGNPYPRMVETFLHGGRPIELCRFHKCIVKPDPYRCLYP